MIYVRDAKEDELQCDNCGYIDWESKFIENKNKCPECDETDCFFQVIYEDE